MRMQKINLHLLYITFDGSGKSNYFGREQVSRNEADVREGKG